MNKEIENAFVDVRTAFRVLKEYQERIINIVYYIKEQVLFPDIWGRRWYSNDLRKRNDCPEKYAQLNIEKETSGWRFLPAFLLEYYFGNKKVGKQTLEFSVFQISDDGWATTPEAVYYDTSTFTPLGDSHSYLMFYFSSYLKLADVLWLENPDCQEEDQHDFLAKALSSSQSFLVHKNDKGSISVLKKYDMSRFSSQEETDKIIADFCKIVKEQSGIDILTKDVKKEAKKS